MKNRSTPSGFGQMLGGFTRPLRDILSRLKIFHQILLVILIMTVFLASEGGLGLYMMDQMQKITQDIFRNSVQGFQNISGLRQELDQIRKGYILSLIDNQKLVLNLDRLYLVENNLGPISEKVKSEAEIIKGLAQKPVTRANYEELDKEIMIISTYLDQIESGLYNNAIQSMARGNKFFSDSRNDSILILTVSLLVSIGLGVLIAALIAGPLKEMVLAVQSLATGDLTRRLSSKGSREINQLVHDYNDAVSSLQALVSNIHEQAKILSFASGELMEASVNSGKTASEIANVIKELATAASDQADEASRTVNTVNELADLVRKVSGDTAGIAASSQKIATAANIGRKVTGNVAGEISELYQNTTKIGEVIDEMNRTSEEIKEIATIIAGIGEQTTLLALNASIEAARAGEHGKGFSVVAVETGKLAEQSKDASQRISNLITQMMVRSNNAVEVVRSGIERAEAGKALTDQAAVTFESIFRDLGGILYEIEKVAESARHMSERNDNMINSVSLVATISEEGVAGTEEVAASVEEQSASAEEVAALSENLTGVAEKLKQSVATFTI